MIALIVYYNIEKIEVINLDMFCLSKQLLFITIMYVYMYMHIVNLFLRLAKSVHVYTTVHFDANTCYVFILQIKLHCLL